MREIVCPKCSGRGKVPDPETGLEIRRERERLGISQEEVARRMGITQSYLTMLERDKRPWSANMVTAYRVALKMKHSTTNSHAKTK